MLLDLKNEGLNKSNVIKLYHGSKAGIVGPIKPCSRSSCDFGSGFYMGTMREQAFSMVCDYSFTSRKFYNAELDTSGLNVLHLGGLQWLFFVLFCRDEVLELRGSRLYETIVELVSEADILTGAIADDKMVTAFQYFSGGLITDIGVYKALSSVQLGEQFVAVTQRGCDSVRCTEADITNVELDALRQFNKERIEEGNKVFPSIIDDYSNIGLRLMPLLKSGIANLSFKDLPSSWNEVVGRYGRK